MIRRERPAVRATLALARTLSRFDAGFAVPAWRDARLVFDEATLDTLTPVELTVTRIMLTPAPIGAVIVCSLVGQYAVRRKPGTHLAIGSDGLRR